MPKLHEKDRKPTRGHLFWQRCHRGLGTKAQWRASPFLFTISLSFSWWLCCSCTVFVQASFGVELTQ